MKKITDSILLEAKQNAEKIAAEARYDAERLLAETKKECARIEAEESCKCEKELKRLIKRSESARASKQRTRLLEVKQEILTGAVNEAYRKITSLSETEYDDIIAGLLASRMHSGECVIYFPSDKKPSAILEAELKKLAENVGCVYSLAYDRENVRDGFTLVYGGIEENCTFKALFDEKKGEITDYAVRLLFGTEE